MNIVNIGRVGVLLSKHIQDMGLNEVNIVFKRLFTYIAISICICMMISFLIVPLQ